MAIALKKPEKYTVSDYLTWEDGEDWELIDGVVYDMSPSASPRHQIVQASIIGSIHSYLKGKSCKVMADTDVILSEYDVLKPDIIIVCDKNKIKEKNIQGVPDFVVEILSKSTARKDKITKLEKYLQYGVKEYWIVDPVYDSITVYYKEKSTIYSVDDISIPVEIFNGDLKLDLKDIFSE